jgi:hypothetical protein
MRGCCGMHLLCSPRDAELPMQKAAHWRAWISIARMQLANAKTALLSMSLRTGFFGSPGGEV